MRAFACRGSVPDIERYVSHFLGCEVRNAYACVGIVDGGKPVCGILLTDLRDDGKTRELTFHIAAQSPRWCTRKNLHFIADFIFGGLSVTRLSAMVKKTNARSNRLARGLGFKLEGTARRALQGEDAHLYSMLDTECRWLEVK